MGLSSKQDWSQIGELDIPKPGTTEAKNQQQQQKRPILKCPRCESTNTKFCYYNNYSKLQPRHFCRACKRHWTAGGTLRNVPVGGGHRSKRAKTKHDNTNKDSVSRKINSGDDSSQQQLIDTATIFPDIFRQVMSQPPQLPLLQSLLPEIGATTENFCPGSSSSNSSSSFYGFRGPELVTGGEESMLSLMDGYNNGSWLHENLAQPATSFWNCWEGMLELDAPELKMSAALNDS